MTTFGYFLASEECQPEQLVEQAKMAEEAGFTALAISDHYHPWVDAQGSSPFVWSVIGALSQATDLPITTMVTCPTVRTHPAIVAQAAATCAVLTHGRFHFGVGTGTRSCPASAQRPKPKESDPVDGIVLLREDHKTVKRLFREFEKTKQTARPAAKRKLVDQICKELVTHSFIEETVFYPAAREGVPDTTDHVLESVEEHHVMAWLLSEVQNLDPADETFDAKMAVLIENTEHHIEEEEKEWFPQVRHVLGRKQLAELGDQMAAAKSQAPSDPLALTSAAT